VAVDVTATLDRKIAALRCHQSQTGDRDIETFLRARLRDAGRVFGLPYVETFRVISYRR
jgi:LmbE family N-acetylglucosaminyl deacetylase